MNGVNFDYSGAKVLVTGGTSGIGAGIAAAYRDAGAVVTITGTRASAADYDEDLSGYRYVSLNVEDRGQVDAVAAAQEELDILVNNAGIALPSLGLDEFEPDVFERAVTMLLTSAFRMSRGCRDALARSSFPGGASIVGIGSMTSYFGILGVPGYGSAKTGLLGMTRALANQWGPLGIRVNAVAPGLTKSRMNDLTDPRWTEPTLARTPAGRLGLPEDIAGPVLFLTSPAASWITGQMLPIDGGYTVSG